MTELTRRVTPYDLEVRGGDGRTVCGIAVPFDDPTEIREGSRTYVEVFRRGAFARTIEQAAHKVKILAQHDARDRLPLGRAETLREDSQGLYIEAKLSKTRDADEVLELVRDGALDAFSIGFQPIRDNETRNADGQTVVERLEAKLRECSIVTFGAYPNALVSAVRTDAERLLTPAQARRRLAELSQRI